MNTLSEHAIRLSQAGDPYYEEEKSIPLYRGMIPIIIAVWSLICGVGYCLYRSYEAWPV